MEKKIMDKLNVDMDNINYRNITPNKSDYKLVKEHYQILSNSFYQVDLIGPMPSWKNYNYIFVIVNMRTHLTDAMAMKDKTAQTVLNAFKTMLKRNIIEIKPTLIYSDQGSEFKNKIFMDYCKEHDIELVFTRVKTKTQNAIVEMTNNFYGKYLVKYLSYQWQQKGRVYNNWVDTLDTVRDGINEHNKEVYPKYVNYLSMVPDLHPNKYNIGDKVYIKSDYPRRVLTEETEHGYNFRHGDLRYLGEPHTVIGIIRANGRNLRYQIKDSKDKVIFGNFLEKDLIPEKVTKAEAEAKPKRKQGRTPKKKN